MMSCIIYKMEIIRYIIVYMYTYKLIDHIYIRDELEIRRRILDFVRYSADRIFDVCAAVYPAK